MKYFVKFFVVTFFLLICTHTFAEQKIVVLDLTYVLNQSKAGKGAQEFLKKTFNDNKLLDNAEHDILEQIKKTKSSMPFNLGIEKKLNPFLSLKSLAYRNFMQKKGFDEEKMFKYLRDLRNIY